jgi:hypothetical protein
MPTNRRRRVHPLVADRITPEAIDAWRQGDLHGLHRELGVAPCHASPLDVDGPTPPAWATNNPFFFESWPRGWALRVRLIELAGPPGRFDCHGRPLGPAD